MAFGLPQKTDFLIIGGGTAGLVVANRLSEDSKTQVLVLESGPDRTTDPRVKDPNAWSTLGGSELDWQMKTVPQVCLLEHRANGSTDILVCTQAGLNNREHDQVAGRLLGGSSALNGLAWVPPSQRGIDAWSALGNDRWDWSTLLPYLNASHSVTGPGEDSHKEGPIQVTYPALNEEKSAPIIGAWNKALKEQGYDFTSNIMGGAKTVGTRSYAATIYPNSGSRSSADSTYAKTKRPNLHIVTEATVRRIIFSSQSENKHNTECQRAIATGVEVEWNGQVVRVSAEREVILAAGAFNTPKLLELSGVGQKSRLAELGIPVVVDQPGVGENLQNHVWSVLPTPLKVEGIAPGIKALAFTRLDLNDQEHVFFATLEKAPEVVIKSILRNPDEASACLALSVMPGGVALLIAISSFPFSRGSTHISSSAFDVKPVIDPQFFSNDIDIEILARHVQNLHRLTNAPAFEDILQPTEVPHLEVIKKTLQDGTALATHHSCGTVAMLPREAGGVVNENLRVYGTKNVRVVDASIFPLIPHANLVATVFAVAEKAVDMMRDSDISKD